MFTRLLLAGLITVAATMARADGALVAQRATSCAGVNATTGAVCYDETTGEATVGGLNIHTLPTAVQLWNWRTNTSSTTIGNTQDFSVWNGADIGASWNGRWLPGFAGSFKRFCVAVQPTAPAGDDGCRVYLTKNGTEVSGATFDFGSTALDTAGESACVAITGTFTGTDYFAVVFGEANSGQCPAGSGCTCTASNIELRTSLWVTD